MTNLLLPRGVYRIRLSPEQGGVRLDQLLRAELPWLSRGNARRVIDLGGVHIDGRRVRRCSLTLASGQSLEVHIDGLPLSPFALDDAQVLFRDDYLLALDKPAGVATQPTPARFQGTLYAAVQKFLGRGADAELGMVQRLDRDTSGVMVFSIHPRAHRQLTKAFSEHRVDKRYLALLAGTPPEDSGEIRSLLARRHATNRMVSVERGGKPAITRYRVIQRFAEATLVEVVLLTGRTHQIRVHFAESGCPLLGDATYGGPVNCVGRPVLRQMLHASELRLEHPVTAVQCDWRAGLPEDFDSLLRQLRLTEGISN